MKEKVLLIHIDGMPDIPTDINPKTPLELAEKPTLDNLTKNGLFGNVDFKSRVPDTNECTLKMLGYKKHPGRGFVDGIGSGIPIKKDWIYFRCNFAYVNDRGRIKDRRAGRISKGLKELAQRLDGTEIEDVIIHTGYQEGDDHRLGLALEGPGLSDSVRGNDPKNVDMPYQQVLSDGKKGKKTAKILNKFLRESSETLRKHEVNKNRKVPANALLVRGPGKYIEETSFKDKYHLTGHVISAVITVKGIGKYLGMTTETPKGATGSYDTNLDSKLNSVIDAFEENEFVLVHIDGCDIAAHDGLFDEKRKFIERLDKEFLNPLLEKYDIENNTIIITSDHITKTGFYHEPGPVPFLVTGPGIKSNNLKEYTEKESKKGVSYKDTLLDKIIK